MESKSVVGGMMSSVKNMSRWTMNAHQQTESFDREVDEFGASPVALCVASPEAGMATGVGPGLDEPWTCPDPVLYDEDEDEEEEDEAFGDDEEFADDEEYDEEDDDFLEDEDEDLDEEGEEAEEDDDDDEF